MSLGIVIATVAAAAGPPAAASPMTSTATAARTSTRAPGRAPIAAPRTTRAATERAAPRGPASAKPFESSLYFRAGLAAFGGVAAVPFAPGRSATRNMRGNAEGGFEVYLGFDRLEALFGMDLGPADAAWRGDLRALEEGTGPAYRLRAGARIDVDGPADGLGWHVGVQAGLRLASSSLLKELRNPNCTDCEPVRDWRIEGTSVTTAVVPSLLWRAALTEGRFRLDLDVEGALWLGGRSQTVSFSGDPTPEAVRTYDRVEAGRREGFYAAFVARIGLRFGFAGPVSFDRQPQVRERTHRFRPSDARP